MALIRPVVDTEISASTFGQPVYDWITYWTPTAWVGLPYTAPYKDYGAGFQPGQYRFHGDTVTVRGLINSTVTSSLPAGAVFKLPCTFSYNTILFTGTDAPGGSLRMNINADGTFVMFVTVAGSFVMLNITLPVATRP